MANNADFLRTVHEFTKRPEVAVAAAGKTFIDVGSAIIKTTPVGEGEFAGRAKGGWIPSSGSPIESDNNRSEKNDSPLISEVTKVADELKGDGSLFLTNNVIYIRVLEYGGYPTRGGGSPSNGPRTTNGYSKQAPAGMVRVSVEYYNDNLRKNLQEGGW